MRARSGAWTATSTIFERNGRVLLVDTLKDTGITDVGERGERDDAANEMNHRLEKSMENRAPLTQFPSLTEKAVSMEYPY